MVVIRLQRRGTLKKPHHRIVAADRQHSQRGRVLETLGHYDPSYDPPHFSLNEPRLVFWVSSGAQMSEAVAALVKRFKKLSVAAVKS